MRAMRDVMFVLGGCGMAYYFAVWVHDAAKARYQARETAAVYDAAYDLGHMTGSDAYWHDDPEPHAMFAETLDAHVAAAECEVVADQWRLIHHFQLAMVDGWRGAASSDIADSDVVAEFRAWERGREAA